ncbi:MAG: RtcB family protein [Candidatus Cloacimonetes bacterium]|nr:RtcB family protein [Candidatus Cloacimonadota bacterium]
MIEITGKYGSAIVFTENVEATAYSQLKEILDSETQIALGANIRVMPDVHAGLGCVIGTTMQITDKVVPNFVGVDIGCGMKVQKLQEKAEDIDLAKLDNIIKKRIPSGFSIRDNPHALAGETRIEELRCKNFVNLDRAYKSIGTLGGGNHFIELNEDDEGTLYLVIHSGSRHLGTQIAGYYQEEAHLRLNAKHSQRIQFDGKMKKKDFRRAKRKQAEARIPKNLAYCEGELMQDYLIDMDIGQEFAFINRRAMAEIIISSMGWTVLEEFQTIHNYIDTKNMILRKGAVSAQKDEILLIPINMQFGSLICIGKGNPHWNHSAPHGAGRVMSRRQARERVSLQDFRDSMQGIYTSSVNRDTLDEAPMVYKPAEEIMENIKDTVDVLEIIRPIYNFKAAD